MRRFLERTTCLNVHLKQMPTVRYFFLIICTSLIISLIWIQLINGPTQPMVIEKSIQEAYPVLKYMLLWTAADYAPFYYFDGGQRAFIKNNCSVISCYVTNDRKFFNGDMTKFDAIAFNGRTMRSSDLPEHRSPHQKYIYFNMESSDNFPVCGKTFDGFFNWTSTYKLDSDIPYPYILIRNRRREIVGPKTKMQWLDYLPEVDDELAEKFTNKSKAAAWFVSHCSSRSGRSNFVKRLTKVLAHYNYSVDVYGSCGPFKCPRNMSAECGSLLEKDYFFYMSLENSFAEDYVTEKLLTALQNNVVPIVYGGADYSRFLPPGSYIDARRLNISYLADLMDTLINNPKAYRQYFRWKSQYTYSEPKEVENVCALCAALNDEEMVKKITIYDHFRTWWNPNFRKMCVLY